jgi:hypothetical protein
MIRTTNVVCWQTQECFKAKADGAISSTICGYMMRNLIWRRLLLPDVFAERTCGYVSRILTAKRSRKVKQTEDEDLKRTKENLAAQENTHENLGMFVQKHCEEFGYRPNQCAGEDLSM